MKKLFTLTAALILVSAAASAQMFAKDKVGKTTFGVRAGLNVSSIGGKYSDDSDDKIDLKSRAGFHIGAVADIHLFNGFFIQPGLLLTTRGARDKDSEGDYTSKTKYNAMYLEVPVLASFRYDVSPSVNLQGNIGPYLGLGIGGKVKYKETGDGESSEDSEKFFGKSTEKDPSFGAKRFDWGLSFGVGATIKKHYYVGIQYDLGLMNMAIEESWGKETRFHNGNFMLQVGYNF